MESLQFNSLIFNFHDVILLVTAMQCLFFSILLCITNERKSKTIYFLAAFLFAHALIPLNELMMWGAGIKYHFRHLISSFYFFPGVAYYVDAPLLFLCITALVTKDWQFQRKHCFHLLPAGFYLLFVITMFTTEPFQKRMDILFSESFAYSMGFVWMEFVNKWLRIAYLAFSLLLIRHYIHRLQDTNSNMKKAHITWLTSLVGGFLFVFVVEMILIGSKASNIYGEYSPYMFEPLGLTANYLSFILVNLLTYTAIRHFWTFEKIEQGSKDPEVVNEEIVNPELAYEIDSTMRSRKIYLEPDLTLNSLADSLNIYSKDLSMLINRHFKINFYEFVNGYRIEEAKRMLVSQQYKDRTITDIYLAVGFNNKSVFYTFFKKQEGMTPSQFKKVSRKTLVS